MKSFNSLKTIKQANNYALKKITSRFIFDEKREKSNKLYKARDIA